MQRGVGAFSGAAAEFIYTNVWHGRDLDFISRRDPRKVLSGPWSKLLRDAEKEKESDHPLRTHSGRHVLKGEFFALVFSTCGFSGKGVKAIIKRVRELRGVNAA